MEKKLKFFLNNSNTMFWCPEPYMTMEQKTFGNYGVCCRSKPLPYTMQEKTFQEHFNSKQMILLREEFEEGVPGPATKEYCQKCIAHENSGIVSRRQTRIEQIKKLKDPTFYDRLCNTVERSVNKEPLHIQDMAFYSLEFKFFGNLCNLKCMMCHPRQSSAIAVEWKQLKKWNGPVHTNMYADFDLKQKQTFYEEMDMILPNTMEVKFTGGEPLMNQDILDLLHYMKDKGYSKTITLNIITNGTLLPEKFMSVIGDFKKVNCMVSVDGVFELNDYQRVGSKFKDVDNTISKLQQYPNINVLIGAAITAINCGKIDELLLYAKHKGVYIDLTSIVLTPNYLMPQVLPQELKQQYLNRYEQSAYADQFVNVIMALKDQTTFNENQRKALFAKLIDHLNEKDQRDGTNYKEVIVGIDNI